MANTPYWEQLFVGECGHTYAFYSVARDNVGHLESSVPAFQAQIQVLPNTPPVQEAITNREIHVGEYLANLVQRVDCAASPTQTIFFRARRL